MSGANNIFRDCQGKSFDMCHHLYYGNLSVCLNHGQFRDFPPDSKPDGKQKDKRRYRRLSFRQGDEMNSDRWSFGFLFLLALFGLISAWRMPLGQLQEPGPGFFPLALSTLLLALALLGIATARSAAPEASRPGSFWGDLKPPAKIVLSMGLAILVFERAGFLLSISSFLTLLFFWVSRYPWWKALALGMIGGIGGWFLFVRILGVAMPEGLLGF
jgi:hypothetical protein